MLRPNRPRHPRPEALKAACGVALGTVLAMLAVACGAPAPATLRQPDARTVVAAIAEDGLRARLEALATATEGSDHCRAVDSTGCDRAVAFVEQELRAVG